MITDLKFMCLTELCWSLGSLDFPVPCREAACYPLDIIRFWFKSRDAMGNGKMVVYKQSWSVGVEDGMQCMRIGHW